MVREMFDVVTLHKLKYLYVNSNQLSRLPKSIAELPRLEEILAVDNQLTALPDLFSKIKKLHILEIYGNRFAKKEKESIRQRFPKVRLML